MLLRCQPLTDGVSDDVLDVVEGIAGETVINMMKEEKGIVVGRLDMYRTNVLMYHTMVLLAHLTKVRR